MVRAAPSPLAPWGVRNAARAGWLRAGSRSDLGWRRARDRCGDGGTGLGHARMTQFKIGRAALRPASAVLLVVGLVLTGVLTWATARTHDNSNKHLLQLE